MQNGGFQAVKFQNPKLSNKLPSDNVMNNQALKSILKVSYVLIWVNTFLIKVNMESSMLGELSSIVNQYNNL